MAGILRHGWLVAPAVFLLGVALAGCAQKQGGKAPAPGQPGATVGAARAAEDGAPQDASRALTAQESNAPPIVRREQVPDGVLNSLGLMLPRGFKINVFAANLDGPRRLAVAPGGKPGRFDVFVAESRANRIRVLRERNGDGSADQNLVFTQNVRQPYGLAFHPQGWLYVGNTDWVVRFPYQPGATSTDAKPQAITRLTKGGYNQHWTRNLLFSENSDKLYVTVGSSCNTCEEDEPQRAAISVMNPDGSGKRLFASGLRNPVGLAWRPGTSELWTVVNERDWLGDDIPPDYLTLVRDGAFYGWPYAYTDLWRRIHRDPTFGDKDPQKVRQTRAPTVPVQAHSAVLGVAFYPPFAATRILPPGLKPFPPGYAGDAFLTYHGSWNRSAKTGYKVVRVHFQNGRPVSVTDFVRGYLRGRRVWGRPVDVQIAPDGSLLFSDDQGGKIWRVSYGG